MIQHKRWKQIILAAAATALLGTAAACGGERADDRQVIDSNGKQITVMEGKTPAGQDVIVESIQELRGLQGMDWVNGETILAVRPNLSRQAQVIEGKERYPINLLTRSLTDGSEEVLLSADEDQYAGMLSPDKKALFYKRIEESVGYGYMLDMETREAAPVLDRQTPDELIRDYEGEWFDSEHVVFPTMSGEIYAVDTKGNGELLAETDDLALYNVHKVGDRLYYIGAGDKLYLQEGDEPARVLLEQVNWVIPSPDQQSLALVRRTREGEMTLYLADLDGKERLTLSKGMQIFGTAWSRDGTRLAYNIMSADKGASGLFVADAVTGKVTQVAVDIESLANPLQWSPSGEQLMAATSIMTADGNERVTYIITLRQ